MLRRQSVPRQGLPAGLRGGSPRLHSVKATIVYTLARVGTGAVIFIALLYTSLSVYLAALIAAVLAFLISYLFFGSLRRGVAEALARRHVTPARDDDADLEDAVLDGPAPVRPTVRRAAPPAEDD